VDDQSFERRSVLNRLLRCWRACTNFGWRLLFAEPTLTPGTIGFANGGGVGPNLVGNSTNGDPVMFMGTNFAVGGS
jgi:hypothetical protein